jgi:biopolymer transport protein ExbB
VFADFQTLVSYMEMGGFVMIPLVAISSLLWFGLVYRVMKIKFSSKNPRELIRRVRKGKHISDAITARAAATAVKVAREVQTRHELKSRLNEHFMILRQEMNQYRSLVRSLVMIAPLLGLLGTVDGMIETFESLGEMALFTQSGGIAGGISRALFTTQIGLAVSIPGLMFGRIIDRQQMNISQQLDQIRDLVCTQRTFAQVRK